MCTTSSSRGKRPTTAWRARPAWALSLLAAGAALALLAPPPDARAQESGCIRVARQEAVVEGPSLRVRGEVTNACNFPVRNIRVQVEARDANGQVLGTAEAFVDPSVMGAQDTGRFDVPIPTTVEPATVNIVTSWRRGVGY